MTGSRPVSDPPSASRRAVGSVSRFLERLEAALGRVGPARESGGPLLVAFSGGLDSCVLLHALRFGGVTERTVVAAHFDHCMRPGSERDARWTRGICAAWQVPFRAGRATAAPASEDAARRARYGFLEDVRAELGCAGILTAHHADDQAETVLFRAVRGTGIDGLRGIPERRDPWIARPLLEFWREELEGYAGAVGLRWRDDPTNEQLGFARNVLRKEILPALEARVAPGARSALVRLARVAERDTAAWAELMPHLLDQVACDDDSVDAEAVAALGPAVRARILRHLAGRMGRVLDERSTLRAVRFAGGGRGGSRIELGGGLEMHREHGRLVFAKAAAAEDERWLRIPDAGPGQGVARLGGRTVGVCWRPGDGAEVGEGRAGPADGSRHRARLALTDVTFPLEVRARRPGDRLGDPTSGRRVRRLLEDARIPSRMRAGVPIVSDARGRVLWVAGVAQAEGTRADEADSMTITIER